MNFAIDNFVAESADQSEWRLEGWAFSPGQLPSGGNLELDGQRIGSISYGWERKDVLAAFPSTCPSEKVGFRAQIFLPSGLKPGGHVLYVVFFNQLGQEQGRIAAPFSTDHEIRITAPHSASPEIRKNHPLASYLDLLEKTLLGLPWAQETEAGLREDGRDWPAFAHTMIGRQRLHHLRACAETALRAGIPGDFMECGVWRGGACILLRGVLHAYGNAHRNVWVADSFKGLPPPDPAKYPADAGDNLYTFKELAVTLAQVQENFRAYDLLDGQVKFLEGFFSETLHRAPVEQIAVLRLDGDMYESTMDALHSLYPKLSPGGFCIIDDYGAIPACRQAVRDYRKSLEICDPITMIDWTGAWWRKSKEKATAS